MNLHISDCEICSRMDEIENAFYKYGWDDLTRSLPVEAGRLVAAEEISSYDKENNHLRQCPLCGVYYLYLCTYEYLVNGSDDDVTLTRLTPTQVRGRLSDAEYERLIAAHRQNLTHQETNTRGYAAKCLVSHHLEQDEQQAVEALLLNPDTAVVDGALFYLVRLVAENGRLPALVGLRETLVQLAGGPKGQIADRSNYLLKYGLPGG